MTIDDDELEHLEKTARRLPLGLELIAELKTAREECDIARESYGAMYKAWLEMRVELEEAAIRATLAERERCAMVADRKAFGTRDGVAKARVIAGAIRGTE